MTALTEILESIYSVIKTMQPVDFIDIALLSYIIYFFLKLIRETRAGQLFKGIAFLLIVYVIGGLIELKAITYILTRVFDIGVLAILIMFQPEVRRAMEKLGHSRLGLSSFLNSSNRETAELKWSKAIDAICNACEEFSADCTGAIIAIERQTRLGEHIEGGVEVNGEPSKELLGAIFFHNAPLHDGAVIMRDGMVLAAECFFPMPQKEEFINKKLGSRHRAAIGMSENSDAVIVVVSEETGQISVAVDGKLSRNFTKETLHDKLIELLVSKPNEQKKNIFRRQQERNEQNEQNEKNNQDS